MMKNVDRCDRCGKFVEMSQLFLADEDTGESICRVCNDKVIAMYHNERPEIVQDTHLKYLDFLQTSEDINMCEAGQYLAYCFGHSIDDARIILSYWMRTFGKRHPLI